MAAGRHLEYLCPRNRCRSWQVQAHYGLSYEGLCQILALQNHFQTKPLTRALTALCWATIIMEHITRTLIIALRIIINTSSSRFRDSARGTKSLDYFSVFPLFSTIRSINTDMAILYTGDKQRGLCPSRN